MIIMSTAVSFLYCKSCHVFRTFCFSRLISWQNKRVKNITATAKRGIINGKSQFAPLVSENK